MEYFDANAFLFSLTNNFKHAQTGIVASTDTYSVYDCSSVRSHVRGWARFLHRPPHVGVRQPRLHLRVPRRYLWFE